MSSLLLADPPIAPAVEVRTAATSSRYAWLWMAALLIGVAVLTYRPGLHAPFTLDDRPVLQHNSQIRTLRSAWFDSLTRQFGFVTFAVNYQLTAYDVFWLRATNLAIHLAAGLTLFGLARRTFELPTIGSSLRARATPIAAAISLLWFIHPLQTQSVTYVIQRFESLMGLLFLLSVYCLVRGATTNCSWPWYLLCLVAGWLGLNSKESMLVLPLVATSYDRTFLATSWRQLAKQRGWVHVGLVLVTVWLVFNWRNALDPSQPSSAGFGVVSVTPWEYFRTQASVLVHYLRLSVWPDVLCIDYRWPVAHSWWKIAPPGLFILLLLGLSIRGLWTAPRIAFLGTTFFLLLAVTSSFMPIDDLAFEHRMYLPLACVITLLVLSGDAILTRWLSHPKARTLARTGLLGGVVVALSLRTADRNRDYAEPLRLWSKAVSVNPRNARALGYLGGALQDLGKLDEAERVFRKEAELDPRKAMPQNHLGSLMAQQGRLQEAQDYYREAIRLEPRQSKAIFLLGNLYAREGRYDAATDMYRRACELRPDDSEAWLRLGTALIGAGDAPQALAAVQKAIKLHPKDRAAAERLAWIRATAREPELRNGREALQIAERLVSQTGRKDYHLLMVLAAAQASLKDYDTAHTTAEVAQALAELAGDKTELAILSAHLNSYRKRQPLELASFFPPRSASQPVSTGAVAKEATPSREGS